MLLEALLPKAVRRPNSNSNEDDEIVCDVKKKHPVLLEALLPKAAMPGSRACALCGTAAGLARSAQVSRRGVAG
jgi:hypothetical protein